MRFRTTSFLKSSLIQNEDPNDKYKDFEDQGFKKFHELENPQDESSQAVTGLFIMSHTKFPPAFLIDRTNKIKTIIKETIHRPYKQTI